MIKRQKLINKKANKAKYIVKKVKDDTQQGEQPVRKTQDVGIRATKYSYIVHAIEPEYTMNPIYTGGRILCGKQYIYASCDNKIVIYDPVRSLQISSISHENQEIANFCINHSENLIVTFTNNYLLRVIDLETRKQLNCTKINKHFVIDMAFSPNDKFLAIGCVNSVVRIYTVASWKQTHEFRKHRFSVRRVEWHPDPNKLQLLTLDEESNFNIFDYMLNQVVHSVPNFGKNFVLTESGKTIISCDKDIRVWDYKTCSLQHEYKLGDNDIETLCLIDIANTGELLQQFGKTSTGLLFGGEETPLSIINFNDKSNTVQAIEGLCYGPLMKIMTTHSTPKRLIIVSHQQNISVVGFNQNGFVLEATLLGYNDEVIDVRFSKAVQDGYFDRESELMVVATNSSLVKLIDLRTKHCHLINGHKDIVLCVDYSYPYIISSGKDKIIKLWRIDHMSEQQNKVRLVANYKGHSEDVTSVVMAPQSQFIASVSEDKTIKLWAFPTAQKVDIKSSLFTVIAHDKSINAVRCNHNETLLATCSQDRTIKVWDSKSLSLKMVLKGHKRSVWDVSFNKLEKLLASAAADGTVKVWNLVTGECLSTMGEGPALLRVQWLYHNQVVTGSLDGIVRIWDIRKLTSCSFDKHEGKIWSLDVSAMDQKGNCVIVSGANDSRIIIWKDTTEEQQLEQKLDQSKDQQDKFIYSRYVSERDYVSAARIAFQSNLTEMFIKAVCLITSRYNESIEQPKLEDDHIVSAVDSEYTTDTAQRNIQKLVCALLETDLNRLLKIVQDMNTTAKYFKVANLLFRQIVKQQSLEQLVALNKTYSDERSKAKGTAQEFSDRKSDYEQFVERMRLLNERHATRLQTYMNKSYWIDYCWQKSERL